MMYIGGEKICGVMRMGFIQSPSAIERRSMEIIAPHLADYSLTADEIKVYSRIIHAAGDVEYAPLIKISAGAIESIKGALLDGRDVFVDVEMVRTGINKRSLSKFGGAVHCRVADDEIKKIAVDEQITRSMAAMRSFGHGLDGGIVAIGNAPTALFEVLRMIEEAGVRPAAVIGVPVGFVGAADSKAALAAQTTIPFITVEGTKGGSPIAVAALNAILYIVNSARN